MTSRISALDPTGLQNWASKPNSKINEAMPQTNQLCVGLAVHPPLLPPTQVITAIKPFCNTKLPASICWASWR
jgi:hypothetical protein